LAARYSEVIALIANIYSTASITTSKVKFGASFASSAKSSLKNDIFYNNYANKYKFIYTYI